MPQKEVRKERVSSPEILAPAGNDESLRAALAVGADAVYLGLKDGFNARSGAGNFAIDELADVAAQVHRAGARVYLTLNTLVFESELPAVERVLKQAIGAGVDALIVQDPATALFARAISPEIELHASTQMTISSAEAARFAKGLGIKRVVVPRELSVTEIQKFAAETDLELETFIHGAICISWSGQCLSSEAWGGRSANRGQCAQSCRMPYELILDGKVLAKDEMKYPLSPKDLNAFGALPALLEAGVASFKIEGRLKGPAYVMTAVEGVRNHLQSIAEQRQDNPEARKQTQRDIRRMELSFSRGFSEGFLAGTNHQTLVDGRFPKHRGIFLGTVTSRQGNTVLVESVPTGQGLDANVEMVPEPGMGVVFDAGEPEDPNEAGGPLFAVEKDDSGWRLRFGRPGPDVKRIEPGQRVWITSAPALHREAKELMARDPTGRIGVSLQVVGSAETPLAVIGTVGEHSLRLESQGVLTPSRGDGLTHGLLVDKLGAFGGTAFRLDDLNADELKSNLHLPVSELKRIRRSLVTELTRRIERGPQWGAAESYGTAENCQPRAQSLRSAMAGTTPRPKEVNGNGPYLIALCRTDAQLDAVIAAGMPEVELDWMELKGLGKAVSRAKAAGLRVALCTNRVQKPGEAGYDRNIARLEPDAVIVRHWGGLMHFAEGTEEFQPVLHGDFSLNVTNSITGRYLLDLGLDTVTASHDLNARQLADLLKRMPVGRLAVTVHHRIPTFHSEHCVYAQNLSDGQNWRNCGRPCDRHQLALRDHLGREHPVIVDVACRNTVFNSTVLSATSRISKLVEGGARRFRLEFVWESQEETRQVLESYADLLR